MLTLVLIAAAVAVALGGIAALQRSDFRISRSIPVATPPSDVFDQVNDFHRWENWSPWAKLDPAMKQSFEGPPSGKGSVYAWSGNGKVGAGKMTLLKSQPPELINIELDFLRPMKAINLAEFTFKPEGQGTRVTWSMSGRKNFVLKAFGLVMNLDKLIGGDFEKGLAQLKAVAEASAKK